jgi:hypothetical protein
MKYQPPYGITDPNGSYINGNPAAGIEGSIPPAASIEFPMREIVAAIQYSNFVPSDGDLQQLLKAIRSQFLNFAVDNGVANAMQVSLTPALDAYSAGTPLHVLVAHNNTGAATIQANGLGVRGVKRPDGSDLQANDLVAGMIATLIDTGSVYQLQNAVQGSTGASSTYTVGIPYAGDTGSVNNVVAVYSPALTSITEGQFLAVKVANTNTGAVTFKPNALPALPLNRQDGAALQANDILLNETILIENHGTYYQCISYVQSQFPVAPLLRGFRADAAGYGAQGVAPASDTILANYHVTDNSMQTSTFDGFTLTIGAGEAGLWDINGQWVFPQNGYGANNISSLILINGGGPLAMATDNTPANTAATCFVAAITRLKVGDRIQLGAYHQCPVTITTENSNRQFLSAYLISR